MTAPTLAISASAVGAFKAMKAGRIVCLTSAETTPRGWRALDRSRMTYLGRGQLFAHYGNDVLPETAIEVSECLRADIEQAVAVLSN